jgi:hypothetical protein
MPASMPLSLFTYVVGASELMRRLTAVVRMKWVPNMVRRLFVMVVHGRGRRPRVGGSGRSVTVHVVRSNGRWRGSALRGFVVCNVRPIAPMRVCDQAGVAAERPRRFTMVVRPPRASLVAVKRSGRMCLTIYVANWAKRHSAASRDIEKWALGG